MLRKMSALLVSGTLALSGFTSAVAQERTTIPSTSKSTSAGAGRLAPGGAAGIRHAQAQRSNLRNFIPLAVVGGLALLVVVTGNDDDDGTTTTTGTN